MEFLFGAVVLWIVPIFVAHGVGKGKRRAGFLYGFFFGWIGVIIVALLPPRPEMTLEELERRKRTADPRWYEKKKAELLEQRVYRQCPYCKEDMRRDASVCPHCRHESQAWTLHEGYWWTRTDDVWHRLDELTGKWKTVESVREADADTSKHV